MLLRDTEEADAANMKVKQVMKHRADVATCKLNDSHAQGYQAMFESKLPALPRTALSFRSMMK